jgi:hypothetical protein
MKAARKMMDGFLYLSDPTRYAKDDDCVEAVTSLLDYGRIGKFVKDDPLWQEHFNTFKNAAKGETDIKPFAINVQMKLGSILSAEIPPLHLAGAVDLCYQYGKEGHDMRTAAKDSGYMDSINAMDTEITNFCEQLFKRLEEYAPPLPWSRTQGNDEDIKCKHVDGFFQEAAQCMLHNEDCLERIKTVLNDARAYSGLITTRIHVAIGMSECTIASEQMDQHVKMGTEIAENFFDKAETQMGQLGNYKFEANNIVFEASKVGQEIKDIIDLAMAEGAGPMLREAVVSGANVVMKLADMIPPESRRTEAGELLLKCKEACGMVGWETEIQRCWIKLQELMEKNTDPRDTVKDAENLRKATKHPSGCEDYLVKGKVTVEHATTGLETRKMSLMRSLVEEEQTKIKDVQVATTEASWLPAEQKNKDIGAEQMKTLSLPKVANALKPLKDALTALNKYDRHYQKMKGDWTWNHPVDKEVAKALKPGNVALTELSLRQALNLKTGNELKNSIKKELALMQTREVAEKEIHGPLLQLAKSKLQLAK